MAHCLFMHNAWTLAKVPNIPKPFSKQQSYTLLNSWSDGDQDRIMPEKQSIFDPLEDPGDGHLEN
jgi:hypothetical protein